MPFNEHFKLTYDYEFFLQILCRGGLGVYVPEPLVFFRKHDDAMTMPKNAIPRLKEELAILMDGIAEIAPPELNATRRAMIAAREKTLAFHLLESGQIADARNALRRAGSGATSLGLDGTMARLITALPLPAPRRASLWRGATAAAAALPLTR
jgi:hypothetical protein